MAERLWEASTFTGLISIIDDPKTSVQKGCQAVEECISSNKYVDQNIHDHNQTNEYRSRYTNNFLQRQSPWILRTVLRSPCCANIRIQRSKLAEPGCPWWQRERCPCPPQAPLPFWPSLRFHVQRRRRRINPVSFPTTAPPDTHPDDVRNSHWDSSTVNLAAICLLTDGCHICCRPRTHPRSRFSVFLLLVCVLRY